MPGPFVSSDNSGNDEVVVPCPCFGEPHVTDIVYIRSTLNGAELAKINGAMFAVDEENKPTADLSASQMKAMEICVTGWTFTDENDKRIPFDPSMTNMLRGDIWQVVQAAVDKKTDSAKAPKENLNTDGGTESTSPVKELIGGNSVTTVFSPSLSTPSPDSD